MHVLFELVVSGFSFFEVYMPIVRYFYILSGVVSCAPTVIIVRLALLPGSPSSLVAHMMKGSRSLNVQLGPPSGERIM